MMSYCTKKLFCEVEDYGNKICTDPKMDFDSGTFVKKEVRNFGKKTL